MTPRLRSPRPAPRPREGGSAWAVTSRPRFLGGRMGDHPGPWWGGPEMRAETHQRQPRTFTLPGWEKAPNPGPARGPVNGTLPHHRAVSLGVLTHTGLCPGLAWGP